MSKLGFYVVAHSVSGARRMASHEFASYKKSVFKRKVTVIQTIHYIGSRQVISRAKGAKLYRIEYNIYAKRGVVSKYAKRKR
jgi:hypothetical protein